MSQHVFFKINRQNLTSLIHKAYTERTVTTNADVMNGGMDERMDGWTDRQEENA